MAQFYLFSEAANQFLENGKIAEKYASYLSTCPVCDSFNFKPLLYQEGYTHMKCKNCSFVFTNPRLNEKGSEEWYNSAYYNAALAREIYVNTQKEEYFSASLSTDHFMEIVNTVGQNFPRDTKIIDVGCSTGSILAYLKNELQFTNLKGIDLNRKAVEVAKSVRKLDVDYADITTMQGRNDKYDLIINTENIEHVNHLEEYILNIKSLLEQDGHLLVSTPHNDAKAVRLLGLFGDHFCPPNHINYFNASSMERFLNKYGFEIKSLWLDKVNTFNLYGFFKSKFFVRDMVSAEPPYEAYLRAIPRGAKERSKFVEMTTIQGSTPAHQIEATRRKRSLLGKIKNFAKAPLGIKFIQHMVVLAQKQS